MVTGRGGEPTMRRQTIAAREARLLNLPDFAARLSTTIRTIQRLIARGVLVPVQLPGVRRTLLAEADIARLINTSRKRTKRVAQTR